MAIIKLHEHHLVTVMGATGQQGGSVVRSLLQNKADFHIRGITRNTSSKAAKKLADSGVEVFQASGFDKEGMKNAFKGSWAAFVNTNSDDPELENGRRELELGKTILDAAREAGVRHLVYSSAPPASASTCGEFPCQTFDMKYEIQEYARKLGFETVAFVAAGWYMENFLVPEFAQWGGGFPMTPDKEGFLTIRFPPWGGPTGEGISLIAMGDDFGDCVHGIFLSPDEHNGQIIHAASHVLHYEDIAETFTRVTGKPARYVPVAFDDFETHNIHFLEQLVMMLKWIYKMNGRYFLKDANLDPARALKREAVKAKLAADAEKESKELMTWETFVKRHFT